MIMIALFETTNQTLKGNFEINKAVVSISTSVVDTHGLDVGDHLDVNPNLSVGIGTSTSIRVQLKNEKLVINPIGFLMVELTQRQMKLQSQSYLKLVIRFSVRTILLIYGSKRVIN